MLAAEGDRGLPCSRRLDADAALTSWMALSAPQRACRLRRRFPRDSLEVCRARL